MEPTQLDIGSRGTKIASRSSGLGLEQDVRPPGQEEVFIEEE
jgi:hypothetical protein